MPLVVKGIILYFSLSKASSTVLCLHFACLALWILRLVNFLAFFVDFFQLSGYSYLFAFVAANMVVTTKTVIVCLSLDLKMF